ncbi:MAG: hypothetical protein ACE5GN_03640, partial [Waddliaceae bacterium]
MATVAHQQKGVEIRVSLHHPEEKHLLSFLKELRASLSGFLASAIPAENGLGFQMDSPEHENSGSHCFSMWFQTEFAEKVVIRVIGTDSPHPPHKADSLRVSIKNSIQRTRSKAPIAPTSDCSHPWQPFFHMIHGIPMVALTPEGPCQDWIRLMDSYTKGCRCVDYKTENDFRNKFFSTLTNLRNRTREIIELLARHLDNQNETDPNAAFALAFQVCYTLELSDRECELIWMAVKSRYDEILHSKNCLRVIADLVTDKGMPFGLIRSLVEVMGYIHLHTTPRPTSWGNNSSCKLTRMNGVLGMRFGLQDSTSTKTLLLSLKPIESISRFKNEYSRFSSKEEQQFLSQIMPLYERLLPSTPIEQQQYVPDIQCLIDHHLTLRVSGGCVSALLENPSALLSHIGLNLACVANIQGDRKPCVGLILGHLPRSLFLALSPESHKRLIQSLDQFLPYHLSSGDPLLDNLRKTVLQNDSLSENTITIAVIEALTSHPVPENLLFAKKLWMEKAISQKAVDEGLAEAGNKVFLALVSWQEVYHSIQLLDFFQKRKCSDTSRRLKMLVQVCRACIAHRNTNEIAIHSLNLGSIAFPLLLHERKIIPALPLEETSQVFLWLINQLLEGEQTQLAEDLLRLACRLDLMAPTDDVKKLFLKICRQTLTATPGAPVFTAHLWKLGKEKGLWDSSKEQDDFALELAGRLLQTGYEEAHRLGLEFLENIKEVSLDPAQREKINKLWGALCERPLTLDVQKKMDTIVKDRIAKFRDAWKPLKDSINATSDPRRKELLIQSFQELIQELFEVSWPERERIARLNLACDLLSEPAVLALFSQKKQLLTEMSLTFLEQALSLEGRVSFKKISKILSNLLQQFFIIHATTLKKKTYQDLARVATQCLAYSKKTRTPLSWNLSYEIKESHYLLLAKLEELSLDEEAMEFILILDTFLKPQEWHKQTPKLLYWSAQQTLKHEPVTAKSIENVRKVISLAKKTKQSHKTPYSKPEARLYCTLSLHNFRNSNLEEGL